jgi:glycosyltransferase involved in cell wall biosynthesis
MHQFEATSSHPYTSKLDGQRSDASAVGMRAEVVQRGQLQKGTEGASGISSPERRSRILLAFWIKPASREEISADHEPRRDYYELQKELDADIIYAGDAQATFLGRLITRFLGTQPAVAWAAFCRRHQYDYVVSDSDGVGLLFALLLKLSGAHPGYPRHTMIAEYLTPLKKQIFFRLGVDSHLDTIIVFCESQRSLLVDALHVSTERVVKLTRMIDECFWKPTASSGAITAAAPVETGQRPMICAAGVEFRDYPTLLKAVRGLDVGVCIGAASGYDSHLSARGLSNIPPNVTVRKYTYAEMRDLYAEASFVVIPLREVNFTAGLSLIFEAMAMGKAVIVSGTRGQTDVIRDPRNNGRGPVAREWWPGFLDVPGLAETLGKLPTGYYVTPGDSVELRRMIQYLLDHPEVAEELGRNGRRVLEGYFGRDAYIRRHRSAILGEPQPDPEYYLDLMPEGDKRDLSLLEQGVS